MRHTFQPKGVCAMQIDIEVEDGIVQDVAFIGGCNGNGKGIASLARGRKVEEVIDALAGTRCGNKQTSCPDQLAIALRKIAEGA